MRNGTKIVRVDAENYPRFDAMVQRRLHGGEHAGAPADPAVAAALSDPNLWVYAAQADGRFVGWISLLYLPKVGKFAGHGHIYVDELWVEPRFRRRGVARALMDQAEALARQRGAAGTRLYVNTENPAALRLYESCGFRRLGTAYFMER